MLFLILFHHQHPCEIWSQNCCHNCLVCMITKRLYWYPAVTATFIIQILLIFSKKILENCFARKALMSAGVMSAILNGTDHSLRYYKVSLCKRVHNIMKEDMSFQTHIYYIIWTRISPWISWKSRLLEMCVFVFKVILPLWYVHRHVLHDLLENTCFRTKLMT